jgi:hypothetical protein
LNNVVWFGSINAAFLLTDVIPFFMRESLKTASIFRSITALGRRRRNGKIARLPQATRELINHMLHDGLPYATILDKLHSPAGPALPYLISKMNLSNWYHGGFNDWRRQRQLDAFLSSTQFRSVPSSKG